MAYRWLQTRANFYLLGRVQEGSGSAGRHWPTSLPDRVFLMIEKTAREQGPRVIHVVLNWAEELRAKGEVR